jgi:hypothetical protein
MDFMWFLVAMTFAFLLTSAVPYFRGKSRTSSSVYIHDPRGSQSSSRISLASALLYRPQITHIDEPAFDRLIQSDQAVILLDLSPEESAIRLQRRRVPRLGISADKIFEVLRWIPLEATVVVHGLGNDSAIIDRLREPSERHTFYLLDLAPLHDEA